MISFPVCPSHHELLQAIYGNWYSVSLAHGRPSKILVEPNISNPSSVEFRKKEAKKKKKRVKECSNCRKERFHQKWTTWLASARGERPSRDNLAPVTIWLTLTSGLLLKMGTLCLYYDEENFPQWFKVGEGQTQPSPHIPVFPTPKSLSLLPEDRVCIIHISCVLQSLT